MSFHPLTLEDAAAIVRPLDTALLKDLRASVFLERVKVITRNLADHVISTDFAVDYLEEAIKDFANEARQGAAGRG